MAAITAQGLATLHEVVRQIRAIPTLRERESGTYQLLGQPFLVFGEDGAQLFADLRRASGMGTERFALADAPARRKLVDEAKRRAAKLSDE